MTHARRTARPASPMGATAAFPALQAEGAPPAGRARASWAAREVPEGYFDRPGGEPLAAADAARYGAAFGADFSGVRIHPSHPGASALGVRAFTSGSTIGFAPGEYQPGRPSGQHVLAHELAHVVQQSGTAGSVQGEGRADAHYEREANAAATAVGAGRAPGPLTRMRGAPGAGAVVQGYDGAEAAAASVGPTVAPGTLFLDDLLGSVWEAPDHAGEILGEVWDSVAEHWFAFGATLAAFLAAEVVIGALAAAPEPTTATKWAAFILQGLLLLILGVAVAFEAGSVAYWTYEWMTLAWGAGGDPARRAEASRAFCRVLLHAMLLVLAAAGVRAKVGSVGAAREGLAAGSAGELGAEPVVTGAGRALLGKPSPPPSGPLSPELRAMYLAELDSWWFRWKLTAYARLFRKEPVRWSELVELVSSAEFREYATAREALLSGGFAGRGPNGELIIGMSRLLRKIPVLGRSAMDHELVHVFQELTGQALTREAAGLLPYTELLGAEVAANAFGSPAVILTYSGFMLVLTGTGIYVFVE